MISAQPGLIPQEKGNLTQARTWACTVFVDYNNGYVFVALTRDLTAASTLAAKKELSTAALFEESKSNITMQIMEDLLNLHG